MQGLSERSTLLFGSLPFRDRPIAKCIASSPATALKARGWSPELAGQARRRRQLCPRMPGRPTRAEVAFAVADMAQGHGIGTQLLARSREVARACRHRHLRGRRAWRQPSDAAGLPRIRVHDIRLNLDAGVYHVTLDLAPTPAVEAQATAPRTDGRGRIDAAVLRARFRRRHRRVSAARQDRRGSVAQPDRVRIHRPAVRRASRRRPRFRGASVASRHRRSRKRPTWRSSASPRATCAPSSTTASPKGSKALVVITAGFAETGEAGRQLEADLLAAVRRAGIRMVGPNCMGVLNTDPAVQLNATFSPVFPPAGRVAMLSQSGALGLAILDHARAACRSGCRRSSRSATRRTCRETICCSTGNRIRRPT